MTTVIQKVYWTWPEGTTEISFEDWIEALPENEKQECLAAIESQRALRQAAVDRGDLILADEGDVWKDAATSEQGKEVDDVWYEYWTRWQNEVGVVFSTEFIPQ